MQQKQFLTLILGLIGSMILYSCKKNSISPNINPPNTNIPSVVTNTDIDGNHYDTIRIGKQLWMVQPLKVTRYNDGTPIPYIINGNDWAATITGAHCYYGTNGGGTTISTSDSAKYATIYGALYNWYAVNHKGADGKPNLAPKGWHIADNKDWDILIGTLNGDYNFTGGNDATVGGKLKDTGTIEDGTGYWFYDPNAGATNSSGFKALPAGYRYFRGGFLYLSQNAFFWSSTEKDNNDAYYQYLSYDDTDIRRSSDNKLIGLSVVCVKD